MSSNEIKQGRGETGGCIAQWIIAAHYLKKMQDGNS